MPDFVNCWIHLLLLNCRNKLEKDGAGFKPIGIPVISLNVLFLIFKETFCRRYITAFFKVKTASPDFLSFIYLAPWPSADMNSLSPSLKQKSVNFLLRTFMRCLCIQVEKLIQEIEVAFPLPVGLLRAFITSWLFKVACRVQISKKSFYQNSEKFGYSLITDDIIYMFLP